MKKQSVLFLYFLIVFAGVNAQNKVINDTNYYERFPEKITGRLYLSRPVQHRRLVGYNLKVLGSYRPNIDHYLKLNETKNFPNLVKRQDQISRQEHMPKKSCADC